MIKKVHFNRLLAIAVVLAVWGGLMAIANANHGSRTLNAYPETQTKRVGETAIVVAVISSAATEGDVNIDFETVSGPNNQKVTGGGEETDRTQPDNSCSIPQGADRCSISYPGGAPGTDEIVAWIDHDQDNSDNESDPDEERDEGSEVPNPTAQGKDCSGGVGDVPGVQDEPDCTDVVEVTWVASNATTTPTSLDCDDSTGPNTETETNEAGQSETYSCLVRNASGGGTSNTVYAEVEDQVNDPETPDSESHLTPEYHCTSSAQGFCTITVTQAEGEAGTTEICFWVENSGTPTGLTQCGASAELVGENQVGDGSDPTFTGNDTADKVSLTWKAASSGSTTTTSTATGSSSQSGSSSTTTTSRTTTSTRTNTGAMTSPPGQSTSTTTTTVQPETRRVATTLTIRFRRGAFKGAVKSSVARCEKSRLVKLKKKRPGKDRTVGSDTSNKRGAWSIRKRRARGAFYAVVARKVFTAGNGDRVICAPDRSPTKRR